MSADEGARGANGYTAVPHSPRINMRRRNGQGAINFFVESIFQPVHACGRAKVTARLDVNFPRLHVSLTHFRQVL